jgi:hypothetical protein
MKNDFDKQFNRGVKLVVAVWAVVAVLSLTFLGLIIWAVVKLVNHFAG